MKAAWGLLVLAACSAPPLTPDPSDAGPTAPVLRDAGAVAPTDSGLPIPDTDAGLPSVRVDGRRLLVNGVPFEVRAVAWNPVRRGGVHPDGLDFAAEVERDAPRMVAAGFNTVRTYVPLQDRAVLDALHRHGLFVLNTVYSWGGDPASVTPARVNAVKDHPAMLGWLVGNEWNYNGLYVGLGPADAQARLNEVMALVRAHDTRLPLINVYGELPPQAVLDAMPLTDIWAVNAYRGKTFGDLFTRFAERSDKPLLLGEYGADAWNARTASEDQAAQAEATEALTAELHAQWSGRGGVVVGGALFEWCDEWWKDGQGRPDVHDVGGVAPGGGPWPDSTFNEEWWGLVTLERTPRLALAAATRGWGL